jgi:proline iminopeptidase
MDTDLTFPERLAASSIGTYFAYVLHGLVHPELLRAGATEADARRTLAGDGLVRDPDWQTTFATEIDAPPEAVWPWLVQMGFGRGGWYTWYAYDNGGIASAERIVPELQTLAVGDYLPDGPRASEGYGQWRVEALDKPHAMVLFSRRDPFDGREVKEDETSPHVVASWSFILEPHAPGQTKLFVRVRARLVNLRAATLVAKMTRLFFGVGDTVMERTLLEGLKERAERRAD